MKKYFMTLVLLLNICQLAVSTTTVEELTFSDTEINQALRIIGEIFNVSIISTIPIEGKVTRFLRNTNIEDALRIILEPLGYTYEINNNIYIVKNIPAYLIDYNNNNFSIRCQNAFLHELLNEISLLSHKTIIYNANRSTRISFNVFNKPLNEVLNIIKETTKFELSISNDVYTFSESLRNNIDLTTINNNRNINISGSEDHITISFVNQSTNDLLLALFSKYNKEYIILSRSGGNIPFLSVNDITFNNLLKIILESSGQTFVLTDNKYFIYDSITGRQGFRYNTMRQYKFINLTPRIFTAILPPQAMPQTSFRVDNERGIITLIGSIDEVDYYYDLVKNLDDSYQGYTERVVPLNYIRAANIKNLLPQRFRDVDISVVENSNSIVLMLNDSDYQDLLQFISTIDVVVIGQHYQFRYLDPEYVLSKMLPSYIDKDKIILNKNTASLYFNLPQSTIVELFNYFDSIDVAPPIIRYQLLIVEYIKKNNFIFDWGFGVNNNSDITELSINAGVFNNNSDVIGANFDIPTVFGYSFSVFLENQLTEERAKIQMATEVYGISGERVSITNTQTLQYKDDRVDNNGNRTPVYSSTTFGLNLEITGRATSGDEVFLEVSARISDQIPKSGDGQAPDTSEKTVKNTVRTRTGRPVILGGLISFKENYKNNVFPGLGNIPFLGEAFRTHNNSFSNSEFVIYIIPFIQKTEEEIENEREEIIETIFDQGFEY